MHYDVEEVNANVINTQNTFIY